MAIVRGGDDGPLRDSDQRRAGCGSRDRARAADRRTPRAPRRSCTARSPTRPRCTACSTCCRSTACSCSRCAACRTSRGAAVGSAAEPVVMAQPSDAAVTGPARARERTRAAVWAEARLPGGDARGRGARARAAVGGRAAGGRARVPALLLARPARPRPRRAPELLGRRRSQREPRGRRARVRHQRGAATRAAVDAIERARRTRAGTSSSRARPCSFWFGIGVAPRVERRPRGRVAAAAGEAPPPAPRRVRSSPACTVSASSASRPRHGLAARGERGVGRPSDRPARPCRTPAPSSG